MAFDKYVKLPGSERQPMLGATQAGSLDPNEVMQVTLALRPRAAGKKQPSLADVIASGKRQRHPPVPLSGPDSAAQEEAGTTSQAALRGVIRRRVRCAALRPDQ